MKSNKCKGDKAVESKFDNSTDFIWTATRGFADKPKPEIIGDSNRGQTIVPAHGLDNLARQFGPPCALKSKSFGGNVRNSGLDVLDPDWDAK